MSAPNYELIDRAICAIEKEIQGKQVVDVKYVENILITLRDLNSYLGKITYAEYDRPVNSYDEE